MQKQEFEKSLKALRESYSDWSGARHSISRKLLWPIVLLGLIPAFSAVPAEATIAAMVGLLIDIVMVSGMATSLSNQFPILKKDFNGNKKLFKARKKATSAYPFNNTDALRVRIFSGLRFVSLAAAVYFIAINL